jgi:hypothetical protein
MAGASLETEPTEKKMWDFPPEIKRDAETTVQLDDTRLLLAFKEARRFQDLSHDSAMWASFWNTTGATWMAP